MDIKKVLVLIRPGAQWNLRGDSYEGIEWLDVVQLRPTLEEMEAAQPQIDALSYRDTRASAYPPITEFADAFVHQQNGDPTPMAAYVAKCNAVKQSFPKPK